MSNKKCILKVKKTTHHVYAYIIDEVTQNIMAESSTLQLKLPNCNVENCFEVGKDIGKKAKDKKIILVSFDRNGNKYHGKIKAVADGARDIGVEF
jgi:large subunit ribosomal protein L18